MSEETLKPCPFCGEVPSLELKHELSLYNGCITCPQCGVSIERFFETKRECVEDLFAIWNTRPIEDALRKRVQELEAENKKLKKENDELEAEAQANFI